MADILNESSELLDQMYGSGTMNVSPTAVSDTENMVHTEIVSMFPSRVHDEIKTESKVGPESRLSAEQLQELLERLQNRFDEPNSCRPAGVTFTEVQKILEADPDLAYRVHVAEERLGAEMDYVVCADKKNRFTDLRKEPNIKRQIAFLQSISKEAREVAIGSLRDQYPDIPKHAFDRSTDDNEGPNKWEGLLIEKVLSLESMTEDDYRETQAKLPKQKWLDVQCVSWLQASEKQLKGGIAPRGLRVGGDVYVGGNRAGDRFVFRGVRLRA